MNMFKLNRIAGTASLVCMMALSPLPAFAAGNGQQLYLRHCAGCHGESGLGQMKGAPSLVSFDVFNRQDAALIDVIRSGRSMMPSFLGILNDREIRDVINHLRTLR